MDCTIRKGLTGLLAGSMLFLSGFARAGEAADENRGYPATQDATEIPAVQAGGNSAASGFDTSSETDGNTRTDSTAAFPRRRFVHGIGLELRPEYVCPTNPFLAGDNLARQPIDLSLAAHLRYSFRFQTGYTEAPIRESGSPTTVSKTGRSWARPWHSIFSKGRASRG